MKSYLILCDLMDYSMPGLLKLMSIEPMMPSNYLIFCRPLLLLHSIFLNITVFSSESALHIRWPKYWNFSISPSNEYSGLISFRIDCLDLLAVQGTLKSLLHLREGVWGLGGGWRVLGGNVAGFPLPPPPPFP